jgi:MFS family permease
MLQVVRQWWPILIAVGFIQIGNGLSGTLFSLDVDARGLAGWQIGLILSAFYAGNIAGPFLAPAIIKRIAHIATIMAFAAVAALSVAGLATTADGLTLAMLRMGQGVGYSGLYAAIESWLNLGTGDRWRARVFAVYILVQLLGLAGGQFLINGRALGEMTLYLFAAAMIALPAVILPFAPMKNPHFETPKSVGVFALARRAPLGVVAVALSGFTWAAVMATGPVFAQRVGLDDWNKSLFMALPIVGGLVAQFPLGWLADHGERRLVLAGMGLAAVLFAAGGALAAPGAALLIAVTGFGAMTFPLYAVAVALTNEVLSQDHRIAASASVIVFFGLGAIAGPTVTTMTMDSWGSSGFFSAQGIVEAVFAAAVLLSFTQLRRRPAT